MQDLDRKLATFLRGELIKVRTEEKKISKFVLRHAAPGAKGNEVDSWSHDSRMEDDDIQTLANEMVMRAQTDADGLGPGVHRYTVSTVLAKGSSGARFMFRLRAVEESDDEIAGEDSPTTKGLLQQLMRHNEANQRLLAQSLGAIIGKQTQQLDRVYARMEKLEDERATTFLALEEAKTDQHTRDMELMEANANEERKQQGFKKIMELAPVVVNRIAGKDVVPTKTDPLAMIIQNLGASLNEEQIRAIVSQLKPEQQLMFGEIMRVANQKGNGN